VPLLGHGENTKFSLAISRIYGAEMAIGNKHNEWERKTGE